MERRTRERPQQFDRAKLKDLVLYVCAKCERDHLGKVKLHKVLFFADMLRFTDTGRPLTGETYRKQRLGPVAEHLDWALRTLVAERALTVRRVNYYGHEKVEFEAHAAAPADRLSPEELALVDAMIELVCRRHTAAEISELTHNAVWEMAGMGEELPYFTAFELFPAEVTAADLEWAAGEIQTIVQGQEPRPL